MWSLPVKHVTLVTTMAALIAVGACSRAEEDSAAGNDQARGNLAAVPAADITAANAYDIRHERFEAMGGSLKAINRELKGSAPDVGRIQREAANLAGLSAQLSTWFPNGSGPDANAKTRAKVDIWANPDGFRRAHEMYRAQAESFKRVADGGEVEQIRAAAQELGKSCGNCHDDFRGPER